MKHIRCIDSNASHGHLWPNPQKIVKKPSSKVESWKPANGSGTSSVPVFSSSPFRLPTGRERHLSGAIRHLMRHLRQSACPKTNREVSRRGKISCATQRFSTCTAGQTTSSTAVWRACGRASVRGSTPWTCGTTAVTCGPAILTKCPATSMTWRPMTKRLRPRSPSSAQRIRLVGQFLRRTPLEGSLRHCGPTEIRVGLKPWPSTRRGLSFSSLPRPGGSPPHSWEAASARRGHLVRFRWPSRTSTCRRPARITAPRRGISRSNRQMASRFTGSGCARSSMGTRRWQPA